MKTFSKDFWKNVGLKKILVPIFVISSCYAGWLLLENYELKKEYERNQLIKKALSLSGELDSLGVAKIREDEELMRQIEDHRKWHEDIKQPLGEIQKSLDNMLATLDSIAATADTGSTSASR